MDFTESVRHSENRNLSVQPLNASINVRFACGNADVIDDESCGEVVAAVHHNVVTGNDFLSIVLGQETVVSAYADLVVQTAETLVCALHFALSDLVFRVQCLALEIGNADLVRIDDAQRPDSGGREVSGYGRAETACSYEQNLSSGEPFLPLCPKFRQHCLPGISFRRIHVIS